MYCEFTGDTGATGPQCINHIGAREGGGGAQVPIGGRIVDGMEGQ